jgi:hypothetical protein
MQVSANCLILKKRKENQFQTFFGIHFNSIEIKIWGGLGRFSNPNIREERSGGN